MVHSMTSSQTMYTMQANDVVVQLWPVVEKVTEYFRLLCDIACSSNDYLKLFYSCR